MMKKTVFLLSFFVACGPSARAAFEDIPFTARGLGLADSLCAGSDLDSMVSNPASMGGRRKFGSGTSFLSSFRTPQGDANLRLYSFFAIFPKMLHGRNGSLGLLASYRQNPSFSREKKLQLGYGTWHMISSSYGVFDFGVNVKVLTLESIPSAQSQTNIAIDFGAILRLEDAKTLGLSFLNVNNPSFDVIDFRDKAPLVLKIGYKEEMEDYALSLDFSRRSSSSFSNRTYSLNSGFEYYWKLPKKGRLASYSGLNLGDNSSTLSLGAGYNVSARKISYSFQIPLTRSIKVGHSITLNMRFGAVDIESEYEKMIRQEVKYRKDLLKALDESARREMILRDEIDSLRKETEELKILLGKKEREKNKELAARKKLENVVRRQHEAQKRLKELEERRRRNKLNQLRFSFSRDFENYLRLKSSSPGKNVLRGMLERIIREYQGEGIDISRATIELQKIIKER